MQDTCLFPSLKRKEIAKGILLAFDRHYLGIVDIIWTLRYSVTMEEGHAQTSQASYQPCDLHAHPAWLYNISDAIKKERNLSASIYLIILSCPSSRPERTKAVSVFICMNTPIFMVALSLRTNTQSLTIAARRRDHFRKKFPGGKIQFETKDQRDQPYPIAFGPSATPQASGLTCQWANWLSRHTVLSPFASAHICFFTT